MATKAVDPRSVRSSPIAGAWYPGAPEELGEMVDAYLARAELFPTDDALLALISPHAGYPYSGQTAAYAYRQLTNRRYDLVVLLGPSHYEDWGPVAVSAKSYYATPLGLIELDREIVEALGKEIQLTRVPEDREHSLEIQLPFLQRTLGDFKLLPLMMSLPFYVYGAAALEPSRELAEALAALTVDRRVLFVASSDLSHLSDYAAVKKHDARTAELVQAFDVPALAEYMAEARDCRACGDAPIVSALLAAQLLGANRVQVLHRTNSGDVTGARVPGQYTVGYLAAAVYKSKN